MPWRFYLGTTQKKNRNGLDAAWTVQSVDVYNISLTNAQIIYKRSYNEIQRDALFLKFI